MEFMFALVCVEGATRIARLGGHPCALRSSCSPSSSYLCLCTGEDLLKSPDGSLIRFPVSTR